MTPQPLLRSSLSPTNQFLLALLGTGLLACGGGDPQGADPQTVEARLQSTLPGLTSAGLSSAEFLESSEAWNGLADSFDTFDRLVAPNEDGTLLPAAGDDEDEDPAAELAEFLVTEVFNDANYQGNGNYAIPSQLLCPDEEYYDESTSSFESVPDQECLDLVAQIEPRVHVEVAGDGLDFDLLIGPQTTEVVSLELRSKSVALVTDLAQVKIAAEYVAQASNEEIDLPTTMQGVLAASLTVNGPQDVSFAFAIRQALEIGGAFPELGILNLSSAIADPLIDLRLNGAEQSLSASLDLQRTLLSLPWSALDSESDATGTFALDLQGLSSSLTLAADEAVPFGMLISNIGFGQGQSTAKLDAATLVSVDLNKDSGRVFDFIMTPGGANELPVFRFDPGFDLEVSIDLSPLADAGDEVPSYLLGETYRLELENGVQPVEGSDEDGLKAIDGAIRLETSAGTSIEVLSGQCLLASTPEADEHEILGAFAAGPCPL